MAKASPFVRSFNAGAVSALLRARTDLERYPASHRNVHNFVSTAQGPAVSRPGTQFINTVRREGQYTKLLEFVFNERQSLALEFDGERIRFWNADGGLQTLSAVAFTPVSPAGADIQISDGTLTAAVGDQLFLSGFPDALNLNGRVGTVTVSASPDFTIDVGYPAGEAVVAGQYSKVFDVAAVYSETELAGLRRNQLLDVTYLLSSKQTNKLSRNDQFDWGLAPVPFEDGPYFEKNTTPTTLTPTATGNGVPTMTDNTTPSGTCSSSGNRASVAANGTFLGRTIPYALAATDAFHAFDGDSDTYWASDAAQTGIIQYAPGAPFVCDGYCIHAARDNQDISYIAKDYAPGTWSFEGFDGSDWIELDRQEDYVLYDGNKSVFFELQNDTAYEAYRLNVKRCTRNGPIEPRVGSLVLRQTSQSFDLVASATAGLNGGSGFVATDVGRHIRVQGRDGTWRWFIITALVSTTRVTVSLESEPFLDLSDTPNWRLGLWSDTTGWPRVGTFFDNRWYVGGASGSPDTFAASFVGKFERFSPTEPDGAVLDDNGFTRTLNAKTLSAIRWMEASDKGIVVGTSFAEWLVFAGGANGSRAKITPANVEARPSTRRGSAFVDPVAIDHNVVFVQRSQRTVRKVGYSFENDNFKASAFTQLATHLSARKFDEQAYSMEPHSVIWYKCLDGSIVGVTFDEEENVIAWHTHDFGQVSVDSIITLPEETQENDALWLVVVREVNGQTRRFIEKLTPFWDFDKTKTDAWFVDSGLRYEGAPVDTLHGLWHLSGEEVYGHVDGLPFGPVTVQDGSVPLPQTLEAVAVVGLGFEGDLETMTLENGAADGTSFGKVSRMNNLSLLLWDSQGGQVGVRERQNQPVDYVDIEYADEQDLSQIDEAELFTGFIGPVIPEGAYEKDRTISVRKRKIDVLPLNVVGLMPQLHTQDR